MKVLITNDDGYQSTGLMLLCKKLTEAGHEVVVVAPDSQRSAFSHAVNFFKVITVNKLEEYCGAIEAYACSGTPADCVKFGESLNHKYDVVISGPNNGENYGTAIIYSGTVAAAEEAALCGIKAIALSSSPYGGSFSSAVEYVVDNLESLVAIDLDNALININVPDIPMAQIKGVKICKQCMCQLFHDYMEKQPGENQWMAVGDQLPIDDPGSDIDCLKKGYITITPVSLDRTDWKSMQLLKGLER